MFDPNQAGLEAAFRAVRAIERPRSTTPCRSRAIATTRGRIAVRAEAVAEPARASRSSRVRRASVSTARSAWQTRRFASSRPARRHPATRARVLACRAADENVYDLTEAEPPRRRHKARRPRGGLHARIPDPLPAVLHRDQHRSRLPSAAHAGVVHVDASAQGLHHRLSGVRRHSVGRTLRVDLTRYRIRMEFQEYAAREVSALIDRLVSDAEARTGALLDGSSRSTRPP